MFIYSEKATKFEKISHYSILEFLKFNIASYICLVFIDLENKTNC